MRKHDFAACDQQVLKPDSTSVQSGERICHSFSTKNNCLL